AYSVAKIKDSLENGKQVREDGFFNFEESEPSSAFQLWEGAIEAAETENEQKKLKYIGNLIANISFEPNIGRAQSIELLKIARQLSYSQYCLLSIFADAGVKQQLKDGDYRGSQGNYSFNKISVLTEVLELYNLGIVVMPGDTMLGISDVNPRKIDLQGIGKTAYTTMELATIPQDDKVDLINNLSN